MQQRSPAPAAPAQARQPHTLIVENRGSISATGVTRIVSCDENGAGAGNQPGGSYHRRPGDPGQRAQRPDRRTADLRPDRLSAVYRAPPHRRRLAAAAGTLTAMGLAADLSACLALGVLLAGMLLAGRAVLGGTKAARFVLDVAGFALAAVLLCGFSATRSAAGGAALVYAAGPGRRALGRLADPGARRAVCRPSGPLGGGAALCAGAAAGHSSRRGPAGRFYQGQMAQNPLPKPEKTEKNGCKKMPGCCIIQIN